jgi:hypothetical protein
LKDNKSEKMKNCAYCGDYHEENSIYCSKTCSERTYRFRKSLKDKQEEEIPHIKNDGLKDRWCNFCGVTIETEHNLKFCKHEHEADFRESVKRGKPLKIHIDSRTIIQTSKYDRVQEVIEAVVTRNAY